MATYTVLVTGGSGFVGSHVILQLLAAGHQVRTTVRSLAREAEMRATLARAGADAGERLRFFAADLEKDEGWAAAVEGCDYVQHVASPFPPAQPSDENELIRPAREGTLRVLRAARDAGVKRVVVTSSFAAIGYGQGQRDTPYTEADWTDPDGPAVQPYMKSKTLAERAAWEFVEHEGKGMELAVVNPVGIFGPALNGDLSTSIFLVQTMLEGKMPGTPRLWLGVVDVRDVADLQLRAMTDPAAAGERFLAVAGDAMSFHQMASVLRARLGPAGARAPKRELPDWLIRLLALFNPLAREAVPRLGIQARASNAKARSVLGWQPRSNEEAIVASAESLMALGLVTSA
ncbi:dihydroflavonol-4-reductase [Sphingomonas naasensis]|uniref:Aldehyde reductase n=1 Tax=Sphingomonas naasensis TaxID=1344951 RepID=A0A4S1WTP3_9SPHN|nr:aldehyde reductase [Sphingomonas naasensis]NIJ18884.1 dihydroflavonol-4-reductase [Sphingomonas naasensis]TGX46105.1 aldehyde reductase [Sphingomonas naasensis]